jgi:hypothetical protein
LGTIAEAQYRDPSPSFHSGSGSRRQVVLTWLGLHISRRFVNKGGVILTPTLSAEKGRRKNLCIVALTDSAESFSARLRKHNTGILPLRSTQGQDDGVLTWLGFHIPCIDGIIAYEFTGQVRSGFYMSAGGRLANHADTINTQIIRNASARSQRRMKSTRPGNKLRFSCNRSRTRPP